MRVLASSFAIALLLMVSSAVVVAQKHRANDMPQFKKRVWAAYDQSCGTNKLSHAQWKDLADYLLQQDPPLCYHEGEPWEQAQLKREPAVYLKLFQNQFLSKWDSDSRARASKLLEDWKGCGMFEFNVKVGMVLEVEHAHSLTGTNRLSRSWIKPDLLRGLLDEKRCFLEAMKDPDKWMFMTRPSKAEVDDIRDRIKSSHPQARAHYYDILHDVATTGTTADTYAKHKELTETLDNKTTRDQLFAIHWYVLGSVLEHGVQIEHAQQTDGAVTQESAQSAAP